MSSDERRAPGVNDDDRLWLAGVCRIAGLPEDAWMTPQHRPSPRTAVRDLAMFLLGLFGIVHEVCFREPRVVLLMLFVMLIGLPHALSATREQT